MNAVVVTADTLQGLGLKYILDKFFGVTGRVASDMAEVDMAEASRADLYIVTPEAVVKSLDFFMPRRNVTAVMLWGGEPSGDFTVIDTSADESSIIEQLRVMIDRIGSTEVPTVANALSQRETDVLRLVALGFINKEIADKLSISVNTVLSHRKNIIAKLGIRSVSGWGVYAMMNGLMDASELRR